MNHILPNLGQKVNNLKDLLHRGFSGKLNMLTHPKATHLHTQQMIE